VLQRLVESKDANIWWITPQFWAQFIKNIGLLGDNIVDTIYTSSDDKFYTVLHGFDYAQALLHDS